MADQVNAAGQSNALPSRWVARVVMAVLLAEGIWGVLVSLVRD